MKHPNHKEELFNQEEFFSYYRNPENRHYSKKEEKNKWLPGVRFQYKIATSKIQQLRTKGFS